MFLMLDHLLWGRNPEFWKQSEIGPISDFKKKTYLIELKSAHFQESGFQEMEDGDTFWKMHTYFPERSSS